MMKLQIKLKKSLIGRKPNQVKTAHALGLKKINQIVVIEPNDALMGMVKTIGHLIEVQEVE
ncbi:50S ribosomal protein L30 [Mariniplasma sp. M4Ah]|uniref:50S ribosomal protein L30 n=2 Tax=Peloplasma aerotolerans TaxID=3044389 RepID=A0AAW6UD81_9MOLU|nr:50S ribosomal protein L30 [Mariniplasma sp. M4Ah]MDI6453436.1 50S ribosomal protein L30 [Mariniplasma sp. M4Ah]MDR4968880.1 50S ribosomal protein L30 [Acholeplasmataceae bacterium]